MAGYVESEIRPADDLDSHLQVGLALAFWPQYLCPIEKLTSLSCLASWTLIP